MLDTGQRQQPDKALSTPLFAQAQDEATIASCQATPEQERTVGLSFRCTMVQAPEP